MVHSAARDPSHLALTGPRVPTTQCRPFVSPTPVPPTSTTVPPSSGPALGATEVTGLPETTPTAAASPQLPTVTSTSSAPPSANTSHTTRADDTAWPAVAPPPARHAASAPTMPWPATCTRVPRSAQVPRGARPLTWALSRYRKTAPSSPWPPLRLTPTKPGAPGGRRQDASVGLSAAPDTTRPPAVQCSV